MLESRSNVALTTIPMLLSAKEDEFSLSSPANNSPRAPARDAQNIGGS